MAGDRDAGHDDLRQRPDEGPVSPKQPITAPATKRQVPAAAAIGPRNQNGSSQSGVVVQASRAAMQRVTTLADGRRTHATRRTNALIRRKYQLRWLPMDVRCESVRAGRATASVSRSRCKHLESAIGLRT